MQTHFFSHVHRHRRFLGPLCLGLLCTASAFSLGLHSSATIQPVELIEAGSVITGDIDGNAVIDIRDAIIILEVAQGYSNATVEQLRADPNGDGVLTVDDALRILDRIALP